MSGVKLAAEPSEIVSRVSEAHRLAQEAKSNGNAAVMAACEAGAMLSRVKASLGSRKWAPWVRQTFGTSLSLETADRWVKLSSSRVTRIESAHSLTAAYVMVGIMAEPERKTQTQDTGYVDVYKVARGRILQTVQRASRVFNSVHVDDLPDEHVQALREDLAPLLPMFRRLLL